jgi:RNA polymerase sigma-70 factor (ECF subfamily)
MERGIGAERTLMVKQIVWSALDTLQPRRRAIVVMHELEGLTLPAIARLLGIREITARWHLSMARRELRRLLEPQIGAIR